MKRHLIVPAIALALAGLAGLAYGQTTGQHHGHAAGPAAGHMAGPTGGHTAADGRIMVEIPAPMRAHMLANMRDHLLALEDIQRALATGNADAAAKISETRLGMSSLQSHGAHDIAAFLPKGMADAGTAMHRAASRFAIAAQDAAIAGDLKPALAALSDITTQCNACHAGYRVH
jgi:hypothetical protein